MQKFSELIKKSTEDGVGKKKPAVQKGRFKIAKSDDDKMLAFGWANVSITADGELIEDYQEDIIEPEELESAAYKFAELYREGGEMHERGGAAVLIGAVQPYSKADATLLVIALRYLADQVEKKNGCALAVKALSKTIEFPELEEVEKVRKATEGLSKESE